MSILVSEIRQRIYLVRDLEVVLDADLAEFYHTETRHINRTVARHPDRFPPEGAFRLTAKEYAALTLRTSDSTVTSNEHGGRRTLPYGFTREGVMTLSIIFNSSRGKEINTLLLKAFAAAGAESAASVHQTAQAIKNLGRRIDELEAKFEAKSDAQFAALMTSIQQLKSLPPSSPTVPLLPSPTVDRTSFKREQEEMADEEIFPEARKFFREKEGMRKITAIHRATAEYFGLRSQDLKAALRTREFAFPRQIAIYLMRKHIQLTYKELGTWFGGRDHATIIHACRKIEKLVQEGKGVAREAVSEIEKLIS